MATLHGLAGLAVFAVALPYYGPPIAMLHFLVPMGIVIGAGMKLMRVHAVAEGKVIPLDVSARERTLVLEKRPLKTPQEAPNPLFMKATNSGK